MLIVYYGGQTLPAQTCHASGHWEGPLGLGTEKPHGCVYYCTTHPELSASQVQMDVSESGSLHPLALEALRQEHFSSLCMFKVRETLIFTPSCGGSC